MAIAGVILGHWLVTALVLTPGRTGHGLRDESPLATMPYLTPVSWVFQTLAIFFLVGGYAAARSYRGDYRSWLRQRLVRLSRPVVALVAVWAILAVGLYLGGVPGSTLHTVLTLVLDPLWFLGVFVVLTALTPLAVAMVRRLGVLAAAIPVAVVAAADAVRFDLGGPSWAGWINVVAGWLVPYLLGVAWARGAFPGRRGPAFMLAGGVAATTALVLWAGYPASMVGVNGAAISTLNPPTLAAVTFGIAQVGLVLLLREPLARLMRRPLAWAAVATVNLSAMTLFLWHQTAFLAVTTAGLLAGRLPGLHTAPASGMWIAERVAWLPAFAVALALLWLVFRRAERAPRRPAARGGGGAVVPAALTGERDWLRPVRGPGRLRARGLGREEYHRQDGPGRGDQAGHEAADGQAVQERVGGRGVDRLAGGGMPRGGGPAGHRDGCADRLVGYR